jgi:hypothetical protein
MSVAGRKGPPRFEPVTVGPGREQWTVEAGTTGEAWKV